MRVRAPFQMATSRSLLLSCGMEMLVQSCCVVGPRGASIVTLSVTMTGLRSPSVMRLVILGGIDTCNGDFDSSRHRPSISTSMKNPV